MRDPIVIIGSGATAVHFAQTALELGRKVVMLDVGFTKPAPTLPAASLNQLKTDLADPVQYFLGDDYEALILPDDSSEYYGFPPSKNYVFRELPGYAIEAKGFSPLLSFATGGLAQAWTGGCYPFIDAELEAFPFGWDELEPSYSEVARRIGVTGSTSDDLAPFFPAHDGLFAPITLDPHSQQLLGIYEKKRTRVNERGFFMGHARLASLSRAHNGRSACTFSGRCLWGCPNQAIYTPSVTLEHCKRQPGFEYLGGMRADHFRFDDSNRVTHVVGFPVNGSAPVVREVGTLVLAAGCLPSGRIVLESLLRAGERRELSGLMDNRQVLMPFVNLRQVGERFEDRSYQYHQLAIGAPGARPFDYVHGLVTALTTAMIHPVVQTLPVGARTALALFRNIHAALGLVNINFADERRPGNQLGLEVDAHGRSTKLLVSYSPDPRERERVDPMVRRFRNFLAALGCIAPPNMTRWRPMGASVHYAGTLPMSETGGDLTTDRAGRCRPFENLLVADGSTFPSLPAKNLTFTLMANATRIAHEALGTGSLLESRPKGRAHSLPVATALRASE
ncbi:MAG: GMC oxidoreductase [Polyangiales bacterium]